MFGGMAELIIVNLMHINTFSEYGLYQTARLKAPLKLLVKRHSLSLCNPM